MTPLPPRPTLSVNLDPGLNPGMKAKKTTKDAEWEEAEQGGTSSETQEDKEKPIKIASGADFLLALKANGEVWACSVRDPVIGDWIYVSQVITPLDPMVFQ